MNNHKTIVVWDLFVRIFHWALVILVGLAFLTGDDNNRFHAYAGYAVLLLIALRLIWGLIGSQHARFANFITAPGVAIEYLKGMLCGRPGYFLGHNPAAAWMVVVLLLVLLLVNATGYLALPTQDSGYATVSIAWSPRPWPMMTTTTEGKSQAANSGKTCMKPGLGSCWR